MIIKKQIGKFSFKIPNSYTVEEGVPILVYSSNGVGAIQISLFNTKENEIDFEKELYEIIQEKKNVSSEIRVFNKTKNAISSTIVDERFWFIKLIKLENNLVFFTYNCSNKDFNKDEYATVVDISNSIRIEHNCTSEERST